MEQSPGYLGKMANEGWMSFQVDDLISGWRTPAGGWEWIRNASRGSFLVMSQPLTVQLLWVQIRWLQTDGLGHLFYRYFYPYAGKKVVCVLKSVDLKSEFQLQKEASESGYSIPVEQQSAEVSSSCLWGLLLPCSQSPLTHRVYT